MFRKNGVTLVLCITLLLSFLSSCTSGGQEQKAESADSNKVVESNTQNGEKADTPEVKEEEKNAGGVSDTEEKASENEQNTDKETSDEAAQAETKDEEKDRSELVMAVGKQFDHGHFDPRQGYGTHQQHRLTHSSLLKHDPDLNLIGDLAESYEISEDGITWTFKLNPDIKFSDGEPVTADDVIFTYEMLKEDGVAFELDFLEKGEKIDEHTVAFILKNPRISFISQLTEIPIVPKDKYNDDYSNNPIGSGAYVLQEYKPGEQVIMVANPHYKKDLPFKKLTFLLLDEDAAFAAGKAGGIDVLAIPASFSDQEIPGMSLHAYESIDARSITLPTLPAGNKGKIKGADVEVGNDVTSEKAVRQAINIGIDRESLIELTMNGYGKPAYSVCDGTPWFNEEQVVEDGDIEAAKKILAEAGWKDEDGDGIVEKDGKVAEFDLYYSAADKLRGDLAMAVADQALGFGVKINAISSNWDEIFRVGKANGVLWAGGRHNPYQLFTMYSSKVMDIGYDNMPQYTNALVDEYLDKAMNSSTLEDSYKYWKLAQYDKENDTGVAGIADAPIIWLTRIDHLYFIADDIDVGKQILHPHGYEWSLFNDIDTWKVK